MPTFLHVGCGHKRKQNTVAGFNNADWQEIRLDIDSSMRPDIVGSILDMADVASASVDAVYSSHNIEHVYPHEVPLALSEFFRVLKPAGFLLLTCPDLQSIAKLIADDKLTEAAYNSPAGPISPIDMVYGHRPQLAAGNFYMAHKCGFTLKVLMATLNAARFASVAGKRREAEFFDLWVVASKTELGEEKIRKLAADFFPTRSVG